jgi:hypothetical protein
MKRKKLYGMPERIRTSDFFAPEASWNVLISNLARFAGIPHSCSMLLVAKDLGKCCAVALAMVSNAAMQGAGTRMGTPHSRAVSPKGRK